MEIKTHYGFMLPHHPYMEYMNEQHYPIVQLNIFREGDFKKQWNELYNFPQSGLSLIYSPLSSPDNLGSAYGVMPYINFPFVKQQRYSINFMTGLGIAYLTKKFHRTDNYKNHAISTHLNAILSAQADFRYNLLPYIQLSAGLGVTHFSNGKMTVPNLGINSLSSYLGFAVLLPYTKTIATGKPPTEVATKWERTVFFGAGIKQMYPPGGKFYPATTLSFQLKRLHSAKRKFGIGLDVFYDFTDRAYFSSKGALQPDVAYTKPGIYVLHDFRLGKFSILTHLGTYIYTYGNNQDEGLIYDRIGIQYYITKTFSVSLSLKTHYAKADFIEYAINYSF